MGWHTTLLLILLAHRYISPTSGVLHHVLLPPDLNDDEEPPAQDNNVSPDANNAFSVDNSELLEENLEDEKLEKLGTLLAKLLVIPWPRGTSPLVYVDKENSIEENEPVMADDRYGDGDVSFRPAPLKRTRYYRRYPWKRQNSRYDAENKYLCQPSKDDVFRLLVALHDARSGNRGHVVNFCNRKRPAVSVFNHIRFVGKRK